MLCCKQLRSRKGEEGGEKMSCLSNIPPLTKLKVPGYFSANEKKSKGMRTCVASPNQKNKKRGN